MFVFSTASLNTSLFLRERVSTVCLIFEIMFSTLEPYQHLPHEANERTSAKTLLYLGIVLAAGLT
jgi:hypothetical protein